MAKRFTCTPMQSFKDIPLNLRMQIIKELPKGYLLKYHNISSRYNNEQVVKMGDHNFLCMVLLNGMITPIHYKNLSCDKFNAVIQVSKRLNGN